MYICIIYGIFIYNIYIYIYIYINNLTLVYIIIYNENVFNNLYFYSIEIDIPII